MTFYEILAPFYDQIFKPSKPIFEFLDNHVYGQKILDTACGTGTHVEYLQKQGLDVIGMDLDPKMIEKAVAKAQPNTVFVQDMRMPLESSYHTIMCLGNSLPHVSNEDAIDTIKNWYQALEDKGVLLLQIINFDRIFKHQITSLPTIPFEQGNFIRDYILYHDKVTFKTTLELENESHIQEQVLYPLFKDFLLTRLQKIGFKNIELYGSYKEEPFKQDESYHLIIKAQKKKD